MTTFFDELFRTQPVMCILRGFSPQETVDRAERIWDLGIKVLEVPLEKPTQVASLAAAVTAGRQRGLAVGAGTVCTIEQVYATRDAGAEFTVAPGYDPEVAACSRSLSLPHLPGVATPSEVQAAMRDNHVWLKAFPARVLGVDWFRTIRGPFPQAKLVATGGVDKGNARSFLDAGADVIALGSALSDHAELDYVAQMLASQS